MRDIIDLIESAQPRTARQWAAALPRAPDVVSGLRLRTGIDNLSSIEATLTDFITIGVREVPFSLFSGPDPMTSRIKNLMDEIQESGEIMALIVVIDTHNGPYILEGAHRFDALQYLGCKTFPALVVLDNDDGDFDAEELDEPAPEESWHDDPRQLDLFRTKP
jgi:hypothetical protein